MSNSITPLSLHQLLGIPVDTPLSIDEMCKRLKPVIYPAPDLTSRLQQFCLALVAAMNSLGIDVLSEEDASEKAGRFAPVLLFLRQVIFLTNCLPSTVSQRSTIISL